MPQTIFVRKPTYTGPPAKTSSILDDSPKHYRDRNSITHSYLDSVIFLPSKMKLEEKVKKDSKLSKIACVKVQTVYFWDKHHESFLNWLMMTKEWILFNLYRAAYFRVPPTVSRLGRSEDPVRLLDFRHQYFGDWLLFELFGDRICIFCNLDILISEWCLPVV